MRTALATLVCAIILALAGAGAFYDNFQAPTLDRGYRFFDEPPADSYALADGWLRITANRGQDLWGGQPVKRGAPLLLRLAPPGDYEVRCVVDSLPKGTPLAPNWQVGLFVFQDVRNWLFFGFSYHLGQPDIPNGHGLIVTSTIEDRSTIVTFEEFIPDVATLSILKTKDAWSFRVLSSGSGELNVRNVGEPVGARFPRPWVGMGVKSFQGSMAGKCGAFDNFAIIPL